MNIIRCIEFRWISSGLLIATILAGCASVDIEEPEGGITGTGNNINCEGERNKKRKECMNEM